MTGSMRAARLHRTGEPLVVDTVPVPKPGPMDVLISVKAVNIVPNLKNILTVWSSWFPFAPLPALPAVFGLDASGVIEELGEDVRSFGLRIGDRVYINPERHCGTCRACREGRVLMCRYGALSGYFGNSPESTHLVNRYGGGLAEYMTAPAYSVVKIPDNLSFETAARFGYLGTMYAALSKVGAAPGRTLLVNGISGTLGIGAAIFGPAFGLTTIYGTGRNRELLERVKDLQPGRIEVHSIDDGPVDGWIRERVDEGGVDLYIDALGTGARATQFLEGIGSVVRGGSAINIGAVDEDVPINMRKLGPRLAYHHWFTTGQGYDMAELIATGAVDAEIFEHRIVPLSAVNEALDDFSTRSGGFTNFIVDPSHPA